MCGGLPRHADPNGSRMANHRTRLRYTFRTGKPGRGSGCPAFPRTAAVVFVHEDLGERSRSPVLLLFDSFRSHGKDTLRLRRSRRSSRRDHHDLRRRHRSITGPAALQEPAGTGTGCRSHRLRGERNRCCGAASCRRRRHSDRTPSTDDEYRIKVAVVEDPEGHVLEIFERIRIASRSGGDDPQ